MDSQINCIIVKNWIMKWFVLGNFILKWKLFKGYEIVTGKVSSSGEIWKKKSEIAQLLSNLAIGCNFFLCYLSVENSVIQFLAIDGFANLGWNFICNGFWSSSCNFFLRWYFRTRNVWFYKTRMSLFYPLFSHPKTLSKWVLTFQNRTKMTYWPPFYIGNSVWDLKIYVKMTLYVWNFF